MAVAVREIRYEKGVYGAGDIARYVAYAYGELAGRRSGRWLREVLRPVGHLARRADYTFAELVSVFAVAELVERGVSIARITAARERLAALTGVDQPLALHGIFTDGRGVFAQLHSRRLTRLNLDDGAGPTEPEPLALDGVSFRAGPRLVDRTAVSWSPLPGVWLDPRSQVGTPCLNGTGCQTWIVEARHHDGETIEELQADYSSFVADPDAVVGALTFQRQLRRLRRLRL